MGVVRDGVPLSEVMERTARSHANALPALAARALREAGVTIRDVDALAVSIGPGSFTGLRVGLSFAKGVVFSGGLRLATVPTLDALAVAAGRPGETVCAALDARKRECYAALFALGADGALRRLTEDMALTPAALAERLPAGCVLVGDAAEVYPEALANAATVRAFAAHGPRGSVVARLGAARLAAGEDADPGTIEPCYVRAPEAELARGPSR